MRFGYRNGGTAADVTGHTAWFRFGRRNGICRNHTLTWFQSPKWRGCIWCVWAPAVFVSSTETVCPPLRLSGHRLISFRPPKCGARLCGCTLMTLVHFGRRNGSCRIHTLTWFRSPKWRGCIWYVWAPAVFVSATEMWRPTMRLHSQGTGAFRSPKQYLPRSYSDVVSVTEMVSPHPRYQTGYRSSFRSPKRHTAVISGKPLIASV